MMNNKGVGINVGIMVVFAIVGLTQFTENVRAVQILGLFASGAAFGAALGALITTFKAKRIKEV